MRDKDPFTARLALTALVAIAMLFCAAVPSRARVGARPPSFTLPAVPGGPTHGRFRISDHLGHKPVVILFWATWCAPCRQELPFYQRLVERHGDRLVVVAISMDGANAIASAGAMARRLGVRFPVLSDLDTRVTSRLNPRRSAPFSIWVDARGRIVQENEGFTLGEREALSRGINRLVSAR